MQYFKVSRETETGKKFQAVHDKMKACKEEQEQIAKQFGFSKWRSDAWGIIGGFSSVVFENEPDKKVWKKVSEPNEYMPKLNVKEGKRIQAIFNSTSKVSRHELNMCIGYDESIFNHIGISLSDPKEVVFCVEPEWKVKIPSDCIEITFSEYNKTFNKKSKS